MANQTIYPYGQGGVVQGASSGFTIIETATSIIMTVWDGATVSETATSITIQQS